MDIKTKTYTEQLFKKPNNGSKKASNSIADVPSFSKKNEGLAQPDFMTMVSNLCFDDFSSKNMQKHKNNPNYKENFDKLNKIFINDGLYEDALAGFNATYVSEIAELDFEHALKKYHAISDVLKANGTKETIHFFSLAVPFEKLSEKGVSDILKLARSRQESIPPAVNLALYPFLSILKDFENFDNLDTNKKEELIEYLQNGGRKTFALIASDEAKKIDENSELASFKYIKLLRDKDYLKNFLRNVKANEFKDEIAFIDDEIILNKFDEITDFGGAKEFLDAINSANGKYITLRRIKEFGFNIAQYGEFDKFLKLNYNLSSGDIMSGRLELDPVIMDYISFADATKEAFISDLILENKYNGIINLISKSSDTEFADYLYQNYYLDNIKNDIDASDEIIEKCKMFNDKYGIKIYLSSHITEDISNSIDFIDEEFAKWKKAGGNEAILPKIINFSLTAPLQYMQNWKNTKFSAIPVAYAIHSDKSLTFINSSMKIVSSNLRHEMTHLNDLELHKKGNSYSYEGSESKKIKKAFQRKKYVKEFISAGVNKFRAEKYAYLSPTEYIAVASEGDMSKYSPELKEILVLFGMPEWELNLE